MHFVAGYDTYQTTQSGRHAVYTASGSRTTVFSIDLGFTFQVIARKYTPPKDTFLILSLEAAFAALIGWSFLHEVLLPMQLVGRALILIVVEPVQAKNGKMRTI